MAKAFASRYEGTCVICNEKFPKGALIVWNRAVKGQVAHSTCYETNGNKFPGGTVGTPAFPAVPEDTGNLTSIIAAAVAPFVKVQKEEIIQTVMEVLETLEISGNVGTSLKVEVNAAPPVTIDNPHPSLKKLLTKLANREHVWLYGPAGAGKTTAAKQCADALNLKFDYISLNPQTTDTRLNGFLDATGIFRDTGFYRLYTQGGVFAIEEIANASGNVLTAMNAALENGHASFPCGLVERHPDFVLVACDNTAGRGASIQYNDRRKIDAAFLDRFFHLFWPIDETLEKKIALSINPDCHDWITWVKSVRRYAGKHYPQLLVSPRATYRLAKTLAQNTDGVFTAEEILDGCLWKGIDVETRTKILAEHPAPTI